MRTNPCSAGRSLLASPTSAARRVDSRGLPIAGSRRLVVSSFFSDRPRAVYEFEKRMEVNVATGTIKRVISDRGFGFIVGEDGKEYFFHRDGLAPSVDFDRLVGGESVTFEIESNPKGPRAVQVQTA